MNGQFGGCFVWMNRAADWISKIVGGNFFRFAKLVHVVALASPGNTAQQNRPIMRSPENVEFMPWQTDKRPVRGLPAFPRLFISPKLGCENEHVFEARGQ